MAARPLGRYVFDLAFDGVTAVSVVAHPSLLQLEDLDVRRLCLHAIVHLLLTPILCPSEICSVREGSPSNQ